MKRSSRKILFLLGIFFVTMLMISSATAIVNTEGKQFKKNSIEDGKEIKEESEEETKKILGIATINTGSTKGTFTCKALFMRFWFLCYHGPWKITLKEGGSIDIGGTSYSGPKTIRMPFFVGMASCDGNDEIHFIHGVGFGININ